MKPSQDASVTTISLRASEAGKNEVRSQVLRARIAWVLEMLSIDTNSVGRITDAIAKDAYI